MWNRTANRIATRWLLTERLLRAAASQIEVRTRGGLLVGQCPNDKRAGAWLGYLLGLSFQPEIVMDMKATGTSKQSVYDGVYAGRPAGKPPAGLGYLKKGNWLIYNGVQWTKGTRPDAQKPRETTFRREEMGAPLTVREQEQQSRRRVVRRALDAGWSQAGGTAPQMSRGQKFTLTGFSKLEDMDQGEWMVTRVSKHDGEPTYVMKATAGGRAVQHYAEDVDAVLGDGRLASEIVHI